MQLYNDPDGSLGSGGVESSIGEQIRVDKHHKKSIIAIRNKQYFSPLANTKVMPKHMGRTMKLFSYIPILDDRNVGDQGIDATGKLTPSVPDPADPTSPVGETYTVVDSNPACPHQTNIYEVFTGTTQGSDAGNFVDAFGNYEWVATVTNPDGSSTVGDAMSEPYLVATAHTETNANQQNLYGSSKDVGYIIKKIPSLSEDAKRQNRVGMTRVVIKGSLEKQGFFSEYTEDLMNFDSDSELLSHITTESLVAANEIVEDVLQLDLLNSAGIIRYTGAATSMDTLDDTCELQYSDMLRLSIDLDDNKCPKSTEMITGSRMIDTRVVGSARYMYCGSEMIQTFEAMTDYHGNAAFKPVESYAQAGAVANGEIGACGHFRIIVVPEMMNWTGAGALLPDASFYTGPATGGRTGDAYNAYPCLVVGSGSFSCIGFQTDGKTVKFKVIHKKPGEENASPQNPYGDVGHYAIKWYYGFLCIRPEWIAVVKTAARMSISSGL